MFEILNSINSFIPEHFKNFFLGGLGLIVLFWISVPFLFYTINSLIQALTVEPFNLLRFKYLAIIVLSSITGALLSKSYTANYDDFFIVGPILIVFLGGFLDSGAKHFTNPLSLVDENYDSIIDNPSELIKIIKIEDEMDNRDWFLNRYTLLFILFFLIGWL